MRFSDVVAADRNPVRLNPRHRGIPDGVPVGLAHQTFPIVSFENIGQRRSATRQRASTTVAPASRSSFTLPACVPFAALDDRTRVTEARAFTRRFATDVGDHWLGHFSITNQLRQFLFL